MTTYQAAQAYTNLRWGTMMPIAVMVGSTFAQVRARGTFSVAVSDPAQLAQAVPDPDDLEGYLRSVMLSTINEVIGERSTEVADIAQLTTITPQTVQAFQAKLEAAFGAAGLQLKQISIEAIESV